jgi:twitching motility protein PilT
MQIQEFLTMMIQKGGSDAHIKVGMPPAIRVNGKITQMGDAALTAAETEEIAKQILDPDKWQKFDYCGDLDTSYSIPGVARFRVNVMRQRGAVSLVMRAIPMVIPTFAQLGLPKVCETLSRP